MYPGLSEDDVTSKFYKLGGVARGVLDFPSQMVTVSPETELQSAIDRLTIEQVCMCVQRKCGSTCPQLSRHSLLIDWISLLSHVHRLLDTRSKPFPQQVWMTSAAVYTTSKSLRSLMLMALCLLLHMSKN